MTKKKVKAFVCATLLTLAMSVTACGGSKKTVEDYMKEDPEQMKQLEEQMAAMGDESMDVSVEVTGNAVVYVATLKEGYEVAEEDKAAVEENLESLKSAFSTLAGAMDEGIGLEKGTASFGIRYCNPDGSVVAEKSFTAE